MNAISPMFIMMMLLGGGSGNELLDCIPSDVYWQSKEVQVTPALMLVELNSLKADETDKASAVRRLMIIRALGELKSPDTLPALQGLLASKEMFVAQYAQRAIDGIGGKATAAASAVPAERLKSDVFLLPEHCGAVGQIKLPAGGPMDLRKFLATPVAEQPAPAEQPANPQMDKLFKNLIELAERTGNFRIDAATMGISDSIGPEQGFVFFLVRGQGDAAAMRDVIKVDQKHNETEGDLEFYSRTGDDDWISVVSDELMIFFAAPRPGQLSRSEIADAIKLGRGKLDTSPELVKMIESADMTGPMWAAGLITDSYKQAPMLAPFENCRISSQAGDEGTNFKAVLTGNDADAATTAAAQLNVLLFPIRSEISRELTRDPLGQPVADFFNTIIFKPDGNNITAEATMKKPVK